MARAEAARGPGTEGGTDRGPRRAVVNGSERRQGIDQVGSRLREARKARGLSLREIARRISVSPSFVSQVETGKASPSVGTLYYLVNALGLSLDEVMGVEADGTGLGSRPTDERGDGDLGMYVAPTVWPRIDVPLQPSASRPTIKLSGVIWERLTHEEDPFIDFLHVSYAPGSSSCSDDNLIAHGGREYGYVLEGRLDVQVGFELYKLSSGDALHFDSTTPHRLSNPYAETCVALWVVVARKGDTRVTTPVDVHTSHLPGLI